MFKLVEDSAGDPCGHREKPILNQAHDPRSHSRSGGLTHVHAEDADRRIALSVLPVPRERAVSAVVLVGPLRLATCPAKAERRFHNIRTIGTNPVF